MLFGIGAVLGGLAVGALRQLPLWPVTVVIVVAWGLALLPFGFEVPTAVAVACFTLGGAIYGPFVALSVTLMQTKWPPQHLAARLAARSAALLTASPLGTALGGPLTTALGPRATRGGSGLATLVLGAVACVVLLARRRRAQSPKVCLPSARRPSAAAVSLQPDPDLVLFARVRLSPPAPARPDHGRHDERINGQSFLAFIVLSADPKPYDSR